MCLVVLVKLLVFAKCLTRKTSLRKPNHGKRIVTIKPRPKSVCDFLGLLNVYCIVSLFNCMINVFLSPGPT